MPRKTCASRCSARRRRGFNEAAARCRGKRTVRVAFMRSSVRRFNEVAARCRGKQHPRLPRTDDAAVLQ